MDPNGTDTKTILKVLSVVMILVGGLLTIGFFASFASAFGDSSFDADPAGPSARSVIGSITGSRQACGRCGHDNDTGARFCDSCGASLSSTCPSCQAANAADARFCDECGAAIQP